MIPDVYTFIKHLRLNYNILILSGPFIMGALLFANNLSLTTTTQLIVGFIACQVFLCGGVNAYNSYIDDDDGPIGGWQHPQKMQRWMYTGSWVVQLAGLAISILLLPTAFSYTYITLMFCSWLYSSRKVRLKTKPITGTILVGFATGTLTFFMGYVITNPGITHYAIYTAISCALIIIAFYPLSQIYQIEQDKRKKEMTFAVTYGASISKRVWYFLYPLAIALMCASLYAHSQLQGIVLGLGGLLYYLIITRKVNTFKGERQEYKKIMAVKYIGGMLLTMCVITLYLITII